MEEKAMIRTLEGREQSTSDAAGRLRLGLNELGDAIEKGQKPIIMSRLCRVLEEAANPTSESPDDLAISFALLGDGINEEGTETEVLAFYRLLDTTREILRAHLSSTPHLLAAFEIATAKSITQGPPLETLQRMLAEVRAREW
jgi:hypothetical protein